MPTAEELQILSLSLRVAAVGTILCFPFALAISWFLAKSAMRGKLLLDSLISFPLVLPPVVIGYALLLTFGRHGPLGKLLSEMGIELIFTWWAAAVAAGIVGLPLMIRAMEVSIARVDPRLEQIARGLGAGPWRTFITVTVRIAWPGIVAGVVLAFARALGEFGATIVVAGNIPGSTQTLALGIFTQLQTGNDAAAMRLVVFSLALAIGALAAHHYLVRRTSG